jgi:hypothetical protein
MSACQKIIILKGDRMTIGNAIVFIKRTLTDSVLRERLNAASDKEEFDRVLTEEFLDFSNNEFDEAYNHTLFECQNADKAEHLMDFKIWWEFLVTILNPSTCRTSCSGCG